jgi:hypothetical protein
MKAFITGLLKGRITRWSILAAGAALVVLLGTAASDQGKGQYKLGGTFIGNNGANIWSGLNIPLDPAGRTAVLRVNVSTPGSGVAELLSAFGADTLTEFVGEEAMTGLDTAKYGTIAYANKQGNPPQRCAIWVMNGTLKFTGPDTFVVDYTVDIYPAALDADSDGFPDPGTVPALSVPGQDYARRVPMP